MRLAEDRRQHGVEMHELLVVWLAPLPSFGVSEEPAIDTIVEGSEDPVEALLDSDEIAAVARGLIQLEQQREQPRLGVFVAGPEPAVDRVQVLDDEAQHALAELLIRTRGHRCRVRGGDQPGIRRQGWRRSNLLHDTQKVVLLEHAGK